MITFLYLTLQLLHATFEMQGESILVLVHRHGHLLQFLLQFCYFLVVLLADLFGFLQERQFLVLEVLDCGQEFLEFGFEGFLLLLGLGQLSEEALIGCL